MLVFSERGFEVLIDQAIDRRGAGERVVAHPKWLPTGYEDFLRALGYELDQRKAEAITVTEFDGVVAVGCVALVSRDGRVGFGPFQELLSQEDIRKLLDAAFRRRGRPR
jgi:hypothetical protein